MPCWVFLPWLFEHGFHTRLFLGDLFVNRISTFFAVDVIVSAIVLFRFVKVESSRLGIRNGWLPVVAVLSVGVSLGLPLFLYMRELKMERDRSPDSHSSG